MNYPFSVTTAPGPSSSEAFLSVRPNGQWSSTSQQILHQYLHRFAALANAGALSGASIEPSASGLIVNAFYPSDDTEMASDFSLSRVHVDTAAFEVLLNMLWHFHEHVSRIEVVSIQWQSLKSTLDAAVKPPFPSRWRDLSYELDFADDFGSRFDVVVEFTNAQRTQTVSSVDEEMGRWFAAASLGAYGDEDFPPPISALYYAELPVERNDSHLIWHMNGARCSDGAFDGLINCVQKITERIAPIRKLNIGAD